jgi:hypothetical protein
MKEAKAGWKFESKVSLKELRNSLKRKRGTKAVGKNRVCFSTEKVMPTI